MNKKEKIFISTNIVSVIIIVILIIFLTKKPVIQNTCEPKIQTTQQPSSKDTNIIKCSKHSDCKNNKCGMLNDNLTCCPIGFNGISNTIIDNGIEYCTGVLNHGDKCVDSRQCNWGFCMKEGLNNLGICTSINSMIPKRQCKNNNDCSTSGIKHDGIEDKRSSICNNGLCAFDTKNAGVQCSENGECISAWCKKNNPTDEKGKCTNPYKNNNQECDINQECLSYWCKKNNPTDQKGLCFIPDKKIKDKCDIDEECQSGKCSRINGECKKEDFSPCVIL